MVIVEELEKLKKEQNAIVLAHNYQRPEIQDVADVVGDSLALAMQARVTEAVVLVFCGVDFMAESAKIINPEETVILPDADARCPMAAMVDPDALARQKEELGYDVVSYINTTAETKAVSDICCTSANAVAVVESMPGGVIFTPDENLGRYVRRFVPEKDIRLWPGFCPTHMGFIPEDVASLKEAHPAAEVLVHPESPPDIIDMADAVASTEGMLRHARNSTATEFIVVTERELTYRMKREMPEKKFYPIETAICPNMKRITLGKVVRSLKRLEPEITLDGSVMRAARRPLRRMLDVGRS
jgi:quinolinate synthase